MSERKRPVTIYLSDADREKLEQLARLEERPLSYYLRKVIAHHVKRAGARTPTRGQVETTAVTRRRRVMR